MARHLVYLEEVHVVAVPDLAVLCHAVQSSVVFYQATAVASVLLADADRRARVLRVGTFQVVGREQVQVVRSLPLNGAHQVVGAVLLPDGRVDIAYLRVDDVFVYERPAEAEVAQRVVVGLVEPDVAQVAGLGNHVDGALVVKDERVGQVARLLEHGDGLGPRLQVRGGRHSQHAVRVVALLLIEQVQAPLMNKQEGVGNDDHGVERQWMALAGLLQ